MILHEDVYKLLCKWTWLLISWLSQKLWFVSKPCANHYLNEIDELLKWFSQKLYFARDRLPTTLQVIWFKISWFCHKPQFCQKPWLSQKSCANHCGSKIGLQFHDFAWELFHLLQKTFQIRNRAFGYLPLLTIDTDSYLLKSSIPFWKLNTKPATF